jgi:hypothetical protein
MKIVVDDTSFVIGLCELFRQQMKSYEVRTLLPLAEASCRALNVPPATVAVEGYYGESAELSRFFLLVRALQATYACPVPVESGAQAMRQLRQVLTSPAMGRLVSSDYLLPRMSSPFSEALTTLPSWTVDGLTDRAGLLVRDDDAGLVSVAAAAGSPVALCVARETVALMADVAWAEVETQEPQFAWAVSPQVSAVAHRFVSALGQVTGIALPQIQAESAQLYGEASKNAQLVGRCILVGDQFGQAYPLYHWWIDKQDGQLEVKDFWSTDPWTTDTLSQTPFGARPTRGACVAAPGTLAAERQRQQTGWLGRLFRRKPRPD